MRHHTLNRLHHILSQFPILLAYAPLRPTFEGLRLGIPHNKLLLCAHAPATHLIAHKKLLASTMVTLCAVSSMRDRVGNMEHGELNIRENNTTIYPVSTYSFAY